MKKIWTITLSLCSLAALSACGTHPDASVQSGASVQGVAATNALSSVRTDIDWKACTTDPKLEEKLKDFQCADVQMPAGYNLRVSRRPAADPSQKKGVIFMASAGANASQVGWFHLAATPVWLKEDLLKHFDLVTFDPVGTGASGAATCFKTEAEENALWNKQGDLPLNLEQSLKYAAVEIEFGFKCARYNKAKFATMSTARMAYDIDHLRQLINEEKINFLTYAAGTYISTTYAQLFPDHIRAMVNDGMLNPAQVVGTPENRETLWMRTGRIEALHGAFQEYLSQCTAAGPERCALAKAGDPATIAEQAFERVQKGPVTVTVLDDEGKNPQTKTFNYSQLISKTENALYWYAFFPELARTLVAVAQAPVSNAAASISAREDETKPEIYNSAGPEYTRCGETYSPKPEHLYDVVQAATDRWSHFGRQYAWGLGGCSYWPIRAKDAFTGPWNIQTQAPVLVVATTFDPFSLYSGAEAYANYFPNSRILTHHGWSSSAFGQSRCVDDIVTKFMIHLEWPAQDASCEADHQPFEVTPTHLRAGKNRILPPW